MTAGQDDELAIFSEVNKQNLQPDIFVTVTLRIQLRFRVVQVHPAQIRKTNLRVKIRDLRRKINGGSSLTRKRGMELTGFSSNRTGSDLVT
jgi:hypothetical protein